MTATWSFLGDRFYRDRSQGCKILCSSNHLIVSVYRASRMQGAGRANDPLYFRCPTTSLIRYPVNACLLHAKRPVPSSGTTINENSNLYLMPLCQLGRLSQWPLFNRPTQLTQRTQPVIFVLNAHALFRDTTMNENDAPQPG